MSKLLLVHLVHILVFGGLLMYVGLVGSALPSFMFPLLMVLALFILGYHVFEAFKKPNHAWANYIHIFLVVPLFLVIGYYGKNTHYMFFEYSLMLSFAAIGYHGFYMVKELWEASGK